MITVDEISRPGRTPGWLRIRESLTGQERWLSSIDAVVVSWFGVASTDVLDELRAMERLDVRAVGDCLAPRRAIDAIWDGFRVGFEI